MHTSAKSIERGDQLDPNEDNTLTQSIAAHVFTQVAAYEVGGIIGRGLWSAFISDFEGWSGETLQENYHEPVFGAYVYFGVLSKHCINTG